MEVTKEDYDKLAEQIALDLSIQRCIGQLDCMKTLLALHKIDLQFAVQYCGQINIELDKLEAQRIKYDA